MISVVMPHKHEVVNLISIDYEGGAFVECKKCGAVVNGNTTEEVIEKWNSRSDDWIPVKKGVPTKTKNVLISIRTHSKTISSVTAQAVFFDKEYKNICETIDEKGFYINHFNIGYEKIDNVIAWMPMMEAYRGE